MSICPDSQYNNFHQYVKGLLQSFDFCKMLLVIRKVPAYCWLEKEYMEEKFKRVVEVTS